MEVCELLRKQYDYVGDLQDGWFLVRKGDVFDGKYGFVHGSLERTIEARYELAYPFMNGCAVVKESGNWNYVSSTGELMFDFIPPRFENGYLSWPIDGFVPVQKKGKWGVMDRRNMLVIPTIFDEPVRMRQIGIYLKRLETQDFEWMDREGNILTSLPIGRLEERTGAGQIEYRIPDPHEFCWYCLDVATCRSEGGFRSFTLGGDPLPREIPISSLRVDFLGGSDYPNDPRMKENWIKFPKESD